MQYTQQTFPKLHEYTGSTTGNEKEDHLQQLLENIIRGWP